MPKAKKLPSGSWRCRIYLGAEIIDGKRIRRFQSVTVKDPSEDGRIECERKARRLEKEISFAKTKETTVADAIEGYIQAKERQKISVTTLTAYRSYQRNAFDQINDLPIRRVTAADIQEWINDYAAEKSPKTVANAVGLLVPALKAALPDRAFHYQLPEKQEIDYYTPTDDDVKALLEVAKGTYLEKAILLAAFGTLRAGEISALTYADIKGTTVTVNKSLAWDGSKWLIKAPKTHSSIRTVDLPPKAIKTILREAGKPSDHIINKSPVAIGDAFRRALTKANLKKFRFHDLRAYAASCRHAMGIPDQYIMADGGWKTDSVLKKVYRRTMEDKRKEFSKISSEHFSKILN